MSTLSKNMDKPLTKVQRQFCEEYVCNGCNATKAYLSVKPDLSDDRAYQRAREILHNPRAQEYISYLLEESWKAAAITPARIAKEIADIAFAPIDNENGLTYSVKKDYFNLLQKQLGLQTQKLEADVKTVNIKVDVEDE